MTKSCEGDATKSTIYKSAPHIAACQTSNIRILPAVDRESRQDAAINQGFLAKTSSVVNIRDEMQKHTEFNPTKLNQKNDNKLNQKNDNKLITVDKIDGSFTLTTRLLPRQSKCIFGKGRTTLSQGPFLLVNATTTRTLPRQALGSVRREDDALDPSLVRLPSQEEEKVRTPTLMSD